MELRRLATDLPSDRNSSSEDIGAGGTLVQVDGIWTIFFDGYNYMSLLDATSREDALIQIAEMKLLAIGNGIPVEEHNK